MIPMTKTARIAAAYRQHLVAQCRRLTDELAAIFQSDFDAAIGLCLSLRELFTSLNALSDDSDENQLNYVKDAFADLLANIEIEDEPAKPAETFMQFVLAVEDYLKEEFGWKIEDWPQSLLREYVLYALLRARSFNVRSQSNIAAYIHLAINLGRNFHRDERYPWAKEYLNLQGDENSRVDEMLWRAMGESGAKSLRERFPFAQQVPLKERDERVHLQKVE